MSNVFVFPEFPNEKIDLSKDIHILHDNTTVRFRSLSSLSSINQSPSVTEGARGWGAAMTKDEIFDEYLESGEERRGF